MIQMNNKNIAWYILFYSMLYTRQKANDSMATVMVFAFSLKNSNTFYMLPLQ